MDLRGASICIIIYLYSNNYIYIYIIFIKVYSHLMGARGRDLAVQLCASEIPALRHGEPSGAP